MLRVYDVYSQYVFIDMYIIICPYYISPHIFIRVHCTLWSRFVAVMFCVSQQTSSSTSHWDFSSSLQRVSTNTWVVDGILLYSSEFFSVSFYCISFGGALKKLSYNSEQGLRGGQKCNGLFRRSGEAKTYYAIQYVIVNEIRHERTFYKLKAHNPEVKSPSKPSDSNSQSCL